MKALSTKYILVKRLEEMHPADAFNVVEIQDSFTFKGEVVRIPECPIFIDNLQLAIGDSVLFPKYSPDSHEVDYEGQKMKMIRSEDIMAIL